MQRFIALIVTITYTLQLLSPMVVWAAEGDPSPTPTPIVETTTATPTPEPTVTPEPTTDPSSSSSSPSPTPVPVSSPTPTPTPNPGSEATASPSPSPEPLSSPTPLPTPSPSPLPPPNSTTNDATPAAALQATDTPSNSPSDTSNQNQGESSSGNSQNSENPADSSSGEANQSVVDANQNTGSAAANASVTTVVNTQLQNACLVIETYDLGGSGNADFSDQVCSPTNQVPVQYESTTSDPPSATASAMVATPSALLANSPDERAGSTVQVDVATDSAQVAVNANSGQNNIHTTGDATLVTGDAFAIASLQDILNTSLINSALLYQIFNIWPSFLGDLVLPRYDQVLPGDTATSLPDNSSDTTTANCTSCGGWLSLLNNQATINQNVSVTANTGENSVSGSSTWLSTGDAFAAANVFNLANSEVSDVGWYVLLLNVASDWSGQVLGWQTGDSAFHLAPGQYMLAYQLPLTPALTQQTATQSGSAEPEDSVHLADSAEPSPASVEETNLATLTQNVSVSANTGQNTVVASGEAQVATGRAVSIANLFSVLNTTIRNSRLYLGIVNILGNWAGNVAFAYPELVVKITGSQDAISVGDTVTYTITYRNDGYDAADDAEIQVPIPAGMEVVSYSNADQATVGTAFVTWNVGQVKEGESGSLSLTLRAKDWGSLAAQPQTKSLLSSLIPKAHAASEERSVTVEARIDSSETQSSTKFNLDSVTTKVYQVEEAQSGSATSSETTTDDSSEAVGEWPLDLQVHHNVNEFVYPHDTVTFTVEVTNQGDAPLDDVTVIHEVLLQGHSMVQMAFPLDSLPAHKRGRLEFGLEIPDLGLTQPQQISTRTWVEATTEQGTAVTTPTKVTSFILNVRGLALGVEPVTPVQAAGPDAGNGEVLGERAVRTSSDTQRRWWLLSGLLLAFILIRIIRHQSEAWLSAENSESDKGTPKE